jgi:homeobox protein cut-like
VFTAEQTCSWRIHAMSERTVDDENPSGSPFEQAIKAWTDIGLTSLQKALDDEGVKIVENQTESLQGRKELANRTKTFRKLNDEEKLADIKALLKLYQTEIDNLTNRGKFAESCFMNLYKLLAEAPDPRPLLEASVDSVLSASEVTRLADENARLNDLVSRHADYDTIKGKLMKLELEFIETARAKVAAKEAEMAALMDEKERSWKIREEELVAQVEDLRANQDMAEARLSAHTSSVVDSSSRLAELELVAGDLERANRRVVQVEKRNLELRTELEAIKSGVQEQEIRNELETKISDLEGENAMVAAKIESMTANLAREKTENSNKIETLERDVGRKANEIDTMRDRLRKQQDYDEIKRELDVLKTIEFAIDDVGDDDDDDNDDVDDDNDNNQNRGAKKLENMLLARNKKLTSELTTLRVANGELTSKLQQTRKEVAELAGQLEATKLLNNRLEEDISTLRHQSSSPTMSTVSGWNSGSWNMSSAAGRASPTSSIIGGGRDPRNPPATTSQETSILPIITQQRDRFRQRNVELEQELRNMWTLVSSLQKEIETVKNDNADLYERSRYVSSYKQKGQSTAEDKYKLAYEEGLTPFQQFRGKETERALSRMGALERIAYSFFRSVLANRLSRNLFLIYCLALHLLVMVIIMYNIHTTPILEVPTTRGASAPVQAMVDHLVEASPISLDESLG